MVAWQRVSTNRIWKRLAHPWGDFPTSSQGWDTHSIDRCFARRPALVERKYKTTGRVCWGIGFMCRLFYCVKEFPVLHVDGCSWKSFRLCSPKFFRVCHSITILFFFCTVKFLFYISSIIFEFISKSYFFFVWIRIIKWELSIKRFPPCFSPAQSLFTVSHWTWQVLKNIRFIIVLSVFNFCAYYAVCFVVEKKNLLITFLGGGGNL